MVYYPDLKRTINYGEIDSDKVFVKTGQRVGKAERIGVASYCGMLHFELYHDKVLSPIVWSPPYGVQLPRFGNDCATKYLASLLYPALDPRDFLTDLEGKFCPV